VQSCCFANESFVLVLFPIPSLSHLLKLLADRNYFSSFASHVLPDPNFDLACCSHCNMSKIQDGRCPAKGLSEIHHLGFLQIKQSTGIFLKLHFIAKRVKIILCSSPWDWSVCWVIKVSMCLLISSEQLLSIASLSKATATPLDMCCLAKPCSPPSLKTNKEQKKFSLGIPG